MAWENKVLSQYQIEFDGTNYDVVSGSASLNFGGEVCCGETMTAMGQYFPTTKILPGEFEAEVPVTAGFNINDFRGRCGLLTIIDDLGGVFIMRTAIIVEAISVKAGEGKAMLKWRGDPVESL